MTARPVRVSEDGVLVVLDERRYGGRMLPWSVVYVPHGHRSHYPTQALSDQQVAAWTELVPKGQ
ncbi:hypothetical protein [Amycolatopsis tolypomycina]|uniref:hypothetical protein n=1 Tax=Amycolatopsis tolypomycina TaxID=208445 RepID=UPI0033B93FCF